MQTQKKYLFTALVLLVSGSLFSKCNNMDTKFEWWSAWDAPKYYPVEMLNGAFMLPKEGVVPLLATASMGQDWGGGAYEAGGNEMLLPEGLYVYWYSFTEDKFYEGAFSFSQGMQDTILQYFREGFNRFRLKKHITYNTITVGLAPGGVVAVWLKGDGKEVEIGWFKAKEGKRLTWERFESSYYRNMKDSAWAVYRQEMLVSLDAADHLKRYGIPFGLWDSYREKFNFRTVMVYEDSACVTDEIYMQFFNGEKESLSLEELKENPYKMRAGIRYVEAYFSYGQEIRYIVLEMNEEEVFKAYKQLYEGNPNVPIELQIRVNKENSSFDLFLVRTEQGNYKRVQLRHTKTNFYIEAERSRYYYNLFRKKNNN